jgi:predicted enzyme related to lactoylglutathione lyase
LCCGLAAKFYDTVFKFPWKENKTKDTTETEMKMFDFSPSVNISGGIMKVPDETGVLQSGSGGICIHWFVEDVEKIGEVIEKAGGKMLTAAQKESEAGLYRYFLDTEGNIGSVYQMVS